LGQEASDPWTVRRCRASVSVSVSVSASSLLLAPASADKFRLLQFIHDTGSISGGAREMGVSDKRTLVLLDSINQAFMEPVVLTLPGGSARLTPLGLFVLARYCKIAERAAALAADDLASLAELARLDVDPKG
jgi:molybdate transport system regulatory protein